MPKFKKGRVGIKIDMTPMVDVAFLLLTFFMLTTQFKPIEEVEIVLPSSHSPIKLPESDVAIITVSKGGGIYMSVDQQNLRVRLFGEDAKLKASVPVQISELKNLLVLSTAFGEDLDDVVACLVNHVGETVHLIDEEVVCHDGHNRRKKTSCGVDERLGNSD